jgi:hypothetical protein
MLKRNFLMMLLAAGLLAACGDDGGSNNSPSEDVGADVRADAGPDAQPDAEPDAEPPFEGTEAEPNNTAGNANAFAVGEAITGQIAQGSGQTSDRDVFSFDLTGGTIFEFELVDTGAGFQTADGNTALVVFSDVEDNFSRVLIPDAGTKRQAFVPADGTYLLSVYDARSNEEEPVEHGGADSTYEVATATVDASPSSLTLPVDQSDELEEDGVDVFELTPDANAVLVAETTAMRPPVASDLDTVLYAWSVTDGQVVAVNDDFPGQDGTYDSRVSFEATASQSYWVVVDSYSNASDATYNLSVTETDDAPNARRAVGAGESLTGEIADAGADAFDTDYFEITLQPGDTFRLEATADDALQPRVFVYLSTAFGAFPAAEGWPVGDTAAVELSHSSTATDPVTYLVDVDDVRNIPADDTTDPEYVGGATFGYTLAGSDVTWTPTAETLPVTLAGSIADVGNYAWYEFTAPVNSIIGLKATTSAADFEPLAATLTDGAVTSGESLVLRLDAETTITAGVRDRYFRGGAGYDFDTVFVGAGYDGVTFNDVAETEPNDQESEAQDLTADLPAAVTGVLDGTSPSALSSDFFKVTLTEGAVLGLFTEGDGDTATDDADTVITVLDANGDTVFANDDYPGQDEDPETYFSAAAFKASADGDYFIVVEPYCVDDPDATECGGNGGYTLKAFLD